MAWHAIYTRSRWEKKVLEQIQEKGITVYLPLIKTLKQWSDRKKMVEEPLFRGYIFVNVTGREYYDALNVEGAIKYINIQGKASVVPEQHIIAVKLYLEQHEERENEELPMGAGTEVEIIAGPLTGITGKIELEGNSNRVYINIDSVGKDISVKIPRKNLKPLLSPTRHTK